MESLYCIQMESLYCARDVRQSSPLRTNLWVFQCRLQSIGHIFTSKHLEPLMLQHEYHLLTIPCRQPKLAWMHPAELYTMYRGTLHVYMAPSRRLDVCTCKVHLVAMLFTANYTIIVCRLIYIYMILILNTCKWCHWLTSGYRKLAIGKSSHQ